MSTVETLVRQLSDIQDQLIALPDDAFDQRFELVRRQQELRGQAADHAEGADKERTTEDLLAELASLRFRSEEQRMVDTSARSHDITRVEGRIARIRGILIERGVDPR